ncbi:MAG: sulfatase [Planctomycetota bacterium]
MRTQIAPFALLAVASCATTDSNPPVAAPPPNIVLIVADDAGYVDFGFQGSTTHPTPHLDRLASEGVRFTQAYVTASVCSPSRAGLLTGRYQQRFGHEFNLPGMADEAVPPELRGLPLSERTIADHLRAQGYATGLVGKWHLGAEPRFHPQERGFDEFFGMLEGSDGYHVGKAKRVLRGRKAVAPEELPYLTDAFGDEAAGFVARHAEKPFFLFLSFTAPHTPMQAREDLLAETRAEFETAARAKNAAMTRSLDDAVGKVLAALDAHGVADNTLLVFTNDNGGALPYNASDNGSLRGTKGTVLEGGLRVPMLMRWPRRLAAGTEYSHPVSTLDLLPTFDEAARSTIKSDRALDGVSLLPFLTDDDGSRPHETLYWKLNWGAAIRRGDAKLVRTPDEQTWLFDLASDPEETTDLSESNPQLAHALGARLEEWEQSLPDPLWVSAPRWREHSLQRYAPDFAETNRKR